MNKTYANSTDGALVSRNPRLALAPGETILVTPDMMSYSIRMWIRSGALLVEPAEAAAKPAVEKLVVEKLSVEPAPAAVAKPAPVKPAAPKPAAVKPTAAKSAAKKPVAKKPAKA